MASGVAVILDIVLGPAEIAPASCQPLQAAWSSVLGVWSSRRCVMAFRGPCRSESCVHQRWWGTRRSQTPLDGVLACTSGGPGDTWRSRTPRGGRSGTPAECAERPSWRGTWRRRTPSQAGGGSGAMCVMRWSPDGRSWQNSTGAVPSTSRPASQVSQCCHSTRDDGAAVCEEPPSPGLREGV